MYKHSRYRVMLDGEEFEYREGIFVCLQDMCVFVDGINPTDKGKIITHQREMRIARIVFQGQYQGSSAREELAFLDERIFFIHSIRRKGRKIKSRYRYAGTFCDGGGLYKFSLDWLYFLRERERFPEHHNERKHQGF